MKINRLRSAALAISLLCAPLMITTAGWAGQASAVQVRLVVKVGDRQKAADRLVRSAEKSKGYFLEKSGKAVTLRVPAANVRKIMAEADKLGLVIDRQFEREDLGGALLEKEAALKAKSDVQRQYLALLDRADAEAALYVEKELIKLVTEVESLKGRIRFLRHRIDFARIEVLFEYRDRAAPVRDGRSSFAWLNSMNLPDLLEEF
jgi:hypothetical protein